MFTLPSLFAPLLAAMLHGMAVDNLSSNLPLGALYKRNETTFRVFAPTADQVELHLYATPTGGQGETVELRHNQDGTWETQVGRDLKGAYYTYSAAGKDPGFHPDRELPDPYSECVTGPAGRSLVVDDHTPIAPRPDFPNEDAIIYEAHVRDFTIDPDSGVQKAGKYAGLTETGTHLAGHPEVSTGLDHIRQLGVNTVQLMPIQEFNSDEASNQYGWGYDPALYNTPDGWYASDPLDGSRVRESKQMVDALHKQGLRVVMDVVYNHLDEGLRQRAGAFEGLAPGYYYRHKADGTLSNGSGCGNEFRSEAPMARRFIKDSLKHWVNEYKVDGFRFDLMGLIDKQTMVELTQELHQIDPNLLIYGEPWAAGETPIPVTDKGSQRGTGFAVFNDNFRDALKGTVFSPTAGGFLQNGGDIARVRNGIAGSVDDFADRPGESLNYVECHDNHTLWDRLTLSAPQASEEERRQMDRLAAAVLLTSQGIPFLQSGQEMLRSKGGDDNSYNKPDSVNEIHWADKLARGDMINYYAGLIALRKEHPMFRLHSKDEVRRAFQFDDAGPPQSVAYTLTDVTGKDSWKRARVIFNASPEAQDFPVPAGRWQTFVTGEQARPGAAFQGQTVRVPGRSALVLGESASP